MPFFVAMRGNPLYTGVQGVRGLYMRRKLNRVRMILKCVYKGGKIRVGITFFSCSVGDFRGVLIQPVIQSGYSFILKWLFKIGF